MEDFYTDTDVDIKKIVPKDNNSVIIEVFFLGENTHEPVLFGLSSKYGIITNILYGNIEKLKNSFYGRLIIEVSKNENYSKFMNELREKAYSVREAGGAGDGNGTL